MQGKRAPELAVDGLLEVFEGLWRLHFSAFVAGDGCVLSTEDVQRMNDELEVGRAHMELVLRAKIDFWSRLPWVLIGLAHVDESRARTAARRRPDAAH